MSKIDNKHNYQIICFKSDEHGEPRHLLINKKTQEPIISVSLYETHLAARSSSYNTRYGKLFNLKHLYQWFAESGIDGESILLGGDGLTPPQVRSFASWLKSHFLNPEIKMSHATRKYINAILNDCSIAARWFMQHYYDRSEVITGRSVLEYEAAINYQKKLWKDKKYKIRERKEAPDLRDEEIKEIENYLKPVNRSKEVNADIAVRDYLIWRMVIELGLRIGEVLAMRMQDIPTRGRPYFSVVRIEERGEDYYDPRPNPPRPKTLSRDLGFLFSNTAFPHLITNYVTEHRYVWSASKGKRFKKFILPHKFLILANSGKPLSQSMASDIAKKISKRTGVDFNWHLGRHAFFNRGYYAATQAEDDNTLEIMMTDLVVWGGWSDEKSLLIYSERVRSDRARYALSCFQKNNGGWGALS